MATQKPNDEPIVVSFMTIRKGVGVLGIALPVVLVAGMVFIFDANNLEPSLSHYYYTRMGSLFVGTLCAVAFFLYCYKGYDLADRITSRLAAVFALIVAFFPADPAPFYSVMTFQCPYWVHVVHFVSASLMFLVFAYISLFLFTKTDDPTTLPGRRRKRQRNVVFRICGVVILVVLVGILLDATIPAVGSALEAYHPIFFLEAVALWAFGFSWMIKGQGMLKD